MLHLLFAQNKMASNSIRDIANELCTGIEADDEVHVISLMDDKILVIKLVLCSHCLREEGGRYNYQWTPVHCAARWGRTHLLEHILSYGGIPIDIMVSFAETDSENRVSKCLRVTFS